MTMKLWPALLAAVVMASGNRVEAQAKKSTGPVPVTMEYYYRIKWGSADEFKRLYRKNHAPLLEEMKQRGFILSMQVDEPFTHMAGGTRWDLRVRIVFRDAAAAVSDPEWDRLWEETIGRLYTDKTVFDAEEKARFALLEDHWDVVVNEVKAP